MNIEGNAALVAGGASGLGEATARCLVGHGAVVTIADVNAEKGQALAAELGARFVACDVREEDQVRAAVEAAGGGGGGLRDSLLCGRTGWAPARNGSKSPDGPPTLQAILATHPTR